MADAGACVPVSTHKRDLLLEERRPTIEAKEADAGACVPVSTCARAQI